MLLFCWPLSAPSVLLEAGEDEVSLPVGPPEVEEPLPVLLPVVLAPVVVVVLEVVVVVDVEVEVGNLVLSGRSTAGA